MYKVLFSPAAEKYFKKLLVLTNAIELFHTLGMFVFVNILNLAHFSNVFMRRKSNMLY